jgi:hypothetical protein
MIVDDARPNFVDTLQAWLSLPNFPRSGLETEISARPGRTVPVTSFGF